MDDMRYQIYDKSAVIAQFQNKEDAEMFLRQKRDDRIRGYTPEMIRETAEKYGLDPRLPGTHPYSAIKEVWEKYEDKVRRELTMHILG